MLLILKVVPSYKDQHGQTGRFSRTEGSVVYPLGFDDPAGLQSQQSLSLLPALSALPSGSFSDAVNLEMQELDSRRQSGTPCSAGHIVTLNACCSLRSSLCCTFIISYS